LFIHSSETVEATRRLQQDYMNRSRQAMAGEWPPATFAARLKMNLAKLFSPLL